MSRLPRGRAVIAPTLLVLAWLAAARGEWARHHAIPTPREVFTFTGHQLATRALWLDLAATMARTCLGLAIATWIGTALAFALAREPARWRAAEPTVEFVRAVPPILVYPVFLLALGYGEAARIAAVVFGASGIVLIAVARAITAAPRERRDAVTMAGVRGLEASWILDAHEALPALFGAMRLALTSSLIVVVVTEMLVGTRYGLGARAQTALLEYRADGLWLVMLLGATLHLALSGLLVFAEWRVVHWQRPTQA